MAGYKNNKIMLPIKEFLIVKEQATYELNTIDMSKVTVFYRKYNQEAFLETYQTMPKGDYRINEVSGNKQLEVTNLDVLDKYYSIQLCRVVDLASSQYNPSGEIDVITLNQHLNEVIADVTFLFSYLKDVGMVMDSSAGNKILAELKPNTTWFMDENGNMAAMPVNSLFEGFNQLVETLRQQILTLLTQDYSKLSQDLKDETTLLIKSLSDKFDELVTESKEVLDEYTQEKIQEIKLTCDRLLLISEYKVWKANTIEGLKTMDFLQVGDVVEVLGYYTSGDGAGHKRVIADSDDGSGVQLGNSLWANIIHNGEVNVSWFGLKDNDENYDINSIITKIQNIGGRVIIDKTMTLYSKSQAVLTKGIDFKGSTIINKYSVETTASKMGIFINGALEDDFYIKNLTLDCGKIAGKGFGFRLEEENRINSMTFDNVKIMNVGNPQGSTGCDVAGIDIRGAIDNIVAKNVCIDDVDWTLGADVKVFTAGITISRSTADNSVPKNILLENIICKNITEHSNNYIDPTNKGFSVTPDSDAIKVLAGQTANLTMRNVYVELNDRYAKRAIKLQTGTNDISNVYIKLKNANLGSIIDDQTGRNTTIDNVQVELDNSIITEPFQSVTTGDTYNVNNGGYILRNVSIFGTVFGDSYDARHFIRSNTSSSTTVQTTRDMTIENVKIKAPLNFDVMLDYGRAKKNYGIGEFIYFKNIFVNKVNKAFYSSAYNSSLGRAITGKLIVENFRMYGKNMITLLSPYGDSNTVSAQLYTSIISSDVYVSDENVAVYSSYEKIYPVTANGLSVYNYSYQRLMPPDRFPCNMLIPNATALFNQTWIDISVRMESYTSSFAGQIQTWRILLSSSDSGNIVNCRVFEKEKADYSNRTLLDGLTAIYNKTTKILTIDFSTKPTSYNQWSIEIKAPFEFKFVTETAQGSDTFIATSNVVRDMSFLNTPVMMYAMEQEGGTVKEDYLNYSLEKMKYDAQVQAEEQAKYEAYELLLQDNPELTWEEFEANYGNNVMINLSLVEKIQEPTIPESVKKFVEKYLGTTPTPKVETKPRTFSFDEVDKLNDTLKKL